ncbi:type ISP restriction/modification enzyme [Streptomyces griseoviridis]
MAKEVFDISPMAAEAVSQFGSQVKSKFSAVAVTGSPEDKLRAPFEVLVKSMAAANGMNAEELVLVGENMIAELAARPDYAVTYGNQLIGHIELKAPGKGADPRRFSLPHDKNQGKKLRLLSNVMFSDGDSFSLWQDGDIVGKVAHLSGDVQTAGGSLAAGPEFERLFAAFLSWKPQPPGSPRQLAKTSARLCRLLREEVSEQLARGAEAFVELAEEWRHLLFPSASDDEFADGYAQAVTFGLLLARAENISFDNGIDSVAYKLGAKNSLIGRALSVLTDKALEQGTLSTSIRTLMRVLSVVDWQKLSKGDSSVWLHFYEEFLAEYDNVLRRRTGSYYTPPPVVQAMTRWTDEALVDFLGRPSGLADDSVILVDPAMGTGTFLLEVFRSINKRIADDLGEGAAGPELRKALKRLIGFEIQLGPYAVAQLRLLAELTELGASVTTKELRTYVTDTLSNPYIEENPLGSWYEPIAASRREANKVKKNDDVVVVLGNPPYKEKARGRGGWIETGSKDTGPAKLQAYFPPVDWGVSAHSKHLYNMYVYFWRWAAWKVFEQRADDSQGVICFITLAGFLDGDGFQQMRASLRSQADKIWIINCSPDGHGHQPATNTRIFQGVQHAVCIVVAVKDGSGSKDVPAKSLWTSLPAGHRELKFAALSDISLAGGDWEEVSGDWRAPFMPVGDETWVEYPALDDLFNYSGSGMMPGRTWVYSPDAQSLEDRWNKLLGTTDIGEKRALFVEHNRDRNLEKKLREGLPGYPVPGCSIGDERGAVLTPVRVAFRSFDRQWVIPDKRLINQANPKLWEAHSDDQVYLTALSRTSPLNGPAVTFSAFIPDIDHYSGRGGRVYPLWRDAEATVSNVSAGTLKVLERYYSRPVTPGEIFAYLAGVMTHPGYVKRFSEHLEEPGLRVPVTASVELFEEAVELGSRVLWLHSYGERFFDDAKGRPNGAPRLPLDSRPRVKASSPIPTSHDDMPDGDFDYDENKKELCVGLGRIGPVTPRVWSYEVSGVNVLEKWFSYRRKNRIRPVIGERRISELTKVHPDTWMPEYTAELIDLLNVLQMLVDIEAEQDALLVKIVTSSLVGADALVDENRRYPNDHKVQKTELGEAEEGMIF